MAQDVDDLMTLSLEDLMNVRVSSVSRRLEQMRYTAAAVYVITQEDIRRSGVTDVAELLRMVPGVNVARSNSSTWAVSARGFNDQYATKLLVLVDGRSAYDPGFSGVYWHLQNLILEDIERIEVIRGPGATMWGANAVNGVISITTKSVANTQGGLFVAAAGTNRPAEGAARFGGAIGKNAFYRVHGRQTTRSSSSTGSGDDGGDSWNITNVGFRIDWSLSQKDSLTVDTTGYRGVQGSRQALLTALSPISFQTAGLIGNTGGHILARWSHSFGTDSSLTFQFYQDERRIDGYGAQTLSITDFDLQHNFSIGSRHKVTWGVGRRESEDSFERSLAISFTPDTLDSDLTGAFIQDEIAAVPDKLYFTIGSKLEHSTFTQTNFQPSFHALWLPTLRQSVWGSVSRAVRTANRAERGMNLSVSAFRAGNTVGRVALIGQEDARSEELLAYEAGYRYQISSRLWLDVASYYNLYTDLSTLEPGASLFVTDPSPPHLLVPLYFTNNVRGKTFGAEAAAQYKANDFLAFKTSYSYLGMHLRAPAGSPAAIETENQSPRHQAYLGSFVTLPKSFEVSGHAYFVSRLPTFKVPSYTRLDLNVGWRGHENLELNLGAQNLLGSHMEFGDSPSPANAVGRDVYGKITWRF